MTKAFTPTSIVFSRFLIVLRIAGIAIVIGVNAFVFLTNTSLFNSAKFQAFNIIVDHANEEHQLNKSPFQIAFALSVAPDFTMHEAPLIPSNPFQLLFALFASAIIISLYNYSRFSFIRGEENKPTSFFPAVIVPPPNRFLIHFK